MRTTLVAGNWKLHKTVPEALELAGQLRESLGNFAGTDLLVCPAFPALKPVADALSGTGIAVGGQDLFYEDTGAFTGEVSGPMLRSAGCAFVIVGHSERRQFFGDTGKTVNRKIGAALASGLVPIVCIGEPLEKREHNVTKEFLRKQVEETFAGLGEAEIDRLVVAYEPIWAIGTGRTATPAIAEETQRFVRELFGIRYGEAAARLRILYGGSVKPSNAAELIAGEDIDGFLVGGASLDAASFAGIARACV
ncbi:MAG TPA: triose-phosphate isomerase [bacterium]|nr:triose-phosphate isomerase [bacterium]